LDIDWLLEHLDPDVEIIQPPELLDTRIYKGREGFIDSLLDWPVQWEHFAIDPRRIFAPDDEHIVTVALHRGRVRGAGVDLQTEVVWLSRWRDRRMTRWDMFMTVDEALAAAKAASG
jgi:ketosteroid isomerase-like protein